MTTALSQQSPAEIAGFVVGIAVVLIALRIGLKRKTDSKARSSNISTGIGAIILLFGTILIGVVVWVSLR